MDSKVDACKFDICTAFGIDDLETDTYTLFRMDALDQPTIPIRKEKAPITKSNLKDGELLTLKSNKDVA